MDVYDANSYSYIDTAGIYLATNHFRATDQMAFSMALITAVRLNSLERKIEDQLQAERAKNKTLMSAMESRKLESLGKSLFVSMTTLHHLRYELNIKQELLDIPDILWEFERQSHLFLRLQKNFDVHQRIEQLNARLTWTFSFLETFADFVDKQHSSRLEKIIIALIFLELILGLSEALSNIERSHE
ncbi:putative Sporulation protein RMD1 [Cardiosporidium cionae]|uniref:Sporulation protein RMD1 n=1 Tax=Cardiosporidium cionae TaxID=476202 RepID=A0ABQ7JGE3_9APIC|nr:putative Sporulation protein RMD1 [Cardiosporidium cionae]|eukprot:KAF8822945.1 putative Sporulation protein RMD1 [Cardiosporidium cionae]